MIINAILKSLVFLWCVIICPTYAAVEMGKSGVVSRSAPQDPQKTKDPLADLDSTPGDKKTADAPTKKDMGKIESLKPMQMPSIRSLVMAEKESSLSTTMPAIINKINVKKGESFSKGDVLVELDCSLYQAQLQKANTEINIANKSLALFRRLKSLHGASELEMTNSEAALQKAMAEKKVIAAQLKHCNIVAPFNGIVTQINLKQYEAAPPSQPIMSIMSPESFRVESLVPSSWASKIQKDQVFMFKPDGTDKLYKAIVTGVGARVDPASQSLEIYGKILDDVDGLMIGMTGVSQFDGEGHRMAKDAGNGVADPLPIHFPGSPMQFFQPLGRAVKITSPSVPSHPFDPLVAYVNDVLINYPVMIQDAHLQKIRFDREALSHVPIVHSVHDIFTMIRAAKMVRHPHFEKQGIGHE